MCQKPMTGDSSRTFYEEKKNKESKETKNVCSCFMNILFEYFELTKSNIYHLPPCGTQNTHCNNMTCTIQSNVEDGGNEKKKQQQQRLQIII